MTAPRITARHLRQALATRSGVVVQDMADGSVYALPYGLTKAQAADESLVVILTNVQAAAHLADADGDYAKAARTATTLLAWELELLETRTAGAR